MNKYSNMFWGKLVNFENICMVTKYKQDFGRYRRSSKRSLVFLKNFHLNWHVCSGTNAKAKAREAQHLPFMRNVNCGKILHANLICTFGDIAYIYFTFLRQCWIGLFCNTERKSNSIGNVSKVSKNCFGIPRDVFGLCWCTM